MLLRLEIDNFALIEHLEMDFDEGLTILTGETGAGKSILIDAIGSLIGNRTGKELVRRDCEKASVTGVFELNDNMEINKLLESFNIDASENVIISRDITVSGKTIAKINSKIVPVSLLREITGNLIDIHGQHENQTIFNNEAQLELLDRFAGNNVRSVLDEYKITYREYKDCISELDNFISDDGKKEQIIDLLEFQIREIKQAHPKPGEDEKLTERRNLISSASKIKTTLQESYEFLNGEEELPAMAAVSEAKNIILHNLSGFENYSGIADKLEQIEYAIEDVCENIRLETEKIDVYPEEMQEIEERLDLLFKLKRKYGGNIEGVIDYYRRAVEKLSNIRESESKTKELNEKKSVILKKLNLLSSNLFQARKEASLVLEKNITKELAGLGMINTKFHVDIAHGDTNTFYPNGSDKIEFLISPNPGEALKPLSKIASGGEASRIMLAIKTILADSDSIPTLIFDEVDTGISGKTAGLLGDKLLELSENHQVFCVTHMAAIAAKSDNHFFIEKNVEDNKTLTSVRKLKREGRITEIARLLSGEDNREKAEDLAAEMLEKKTTSRP